MSHTDSNGFFNRRFTDPFLRPGQDPFSLIGADPEHFVRPVRIFNSKGKRRKESKIHRDRQFRDKAVQDAGRAIENTIAREQLRRDFGIVVRGAGPDGKVDPRVSIGSAPKGPLLVITGKEFLSNAHLFPTVGGRKARSTKTGSSRGRSSFGVGRR